MENIENRFSPVIFWICQRFPILCVSLSVSLCLSVCLSASLPHPSGSPFTSILFVTIHNSSCGKVTFSQVCVKYSVHREVYMPAFLWPPPGRHPRVDTLWTDTPPGQTHPLGRHTLWADTPPYGKERAVRILLEYIFVFVCLYL